MSEAGHDIDPELTVILEPRFNVTSTCCSAATTTQLGVDNNENCCILAFDIQDHAPAFVLHRCIQCDRTQLIGPLRFSRPIDI